MRRLYPATSSEPFDIICRKLAAALSHAPFTVQRRSDHLEVAESTSGESSVRLVHYIGVVTAEQAATLGPPDYWDLAWRAAVGVQYNLQLGVSRGSVTRNQQRRFSAKLRSVFTQVKLHGSPAAT